jgi:hypothetical protein
LNAYKELITNPLFLIGLFIGTAGLCYPTYYLFIFWGFLSLLFYSGINLRQMLLVLVGFLIVNGITALLYAYNGNLSYLIEVFKCKSNRKKISNYFSKSRTTGSSIGEQKTHFVHFKKA